MKIHQPRLQIAPPNITGVFFVLSRLLLGQMESYFTNLDFPEIRGFPLLNHHLGKIGREVAIIWSLECIDFWPHWAPQELGWRHPSNGRIDCNSCAPPSERSDMVSWKQTKKNMATLGGHHISMLCSTKNLEIQRTCVENPRFSQSKQPISK